jgi:hypothetical protein
MAELIVSYLITSQNTTPRGRRIHDDGQVDDYQVSKMVKGADGVYRDEAVTPGWYPLVKLNAADVESVRQAIDASGASALPAAIMSDPKGSTANRQAEWQIRTGSGLKTISVSHWPADNEAGQALFELSNRLGEIVTQAINSK